jgi:metal-sulfur cluster biosynthetic enzyme
MSPIRAPGDRVVSRPFLTVGYTWRVGSIPATWWARLLKGSSMAEFTAEQARENLKNVFDPEIGINIVDLGLVYDVDVSDSGDVLVTMTLTSLGCPLGPVIVQEVTNAMSDLPNLGDVDVKLVWSPAWSPEMMSEDARDELGIW